MSKALATIDAIIAAHRSEIACNGQVYTDLDAMLSAREGMAAAEELLAEAARAWNNFNIANATLARLSRYRNLTAGMRDDRATATRKLSMARETLDRVLRVQR